MKKIFIAIIIVGGLASCSQTFNFGEAEKLIDLINEDGRIYSFEIMVNTLSINGCIIANNIEKLSESESIDYKVVNRPDLKPIDISKDTLDAMLLQFQKTNAYSIGFKDGKAYFIMNSLLDSSRGYLYSNEDLSYLENKDQTGIRLSTGYIKIRSKARTKWYNANAWH